MTNFHAVIPEEKLTEAYRLLLEMRDNCVKHADDQYDDLKREAKYEALNIAITAMGRSVPPRWISVKERLPETCKETRSFYHSVTVLASENGRIMIGYFTTSKDDGSFDFSGIDSQKHFYDFAKPSHWMPLPEPPKEE